MTARRFYLRPVLVEAMQLRTGDAACLAACIAFCKGERHTKGVRLKTATGMEIAADGDWIVRNAAGEFFPCKPETFAKVYEAAE